MTCADCRERTDNRCSFFSAEVAPESPACPLYAPTDEAAPDPTEDVASL
jgi:hypothetical protein